jgi:hypothetical protein
MLYSLVQFNEEIGRLAVDFIPGVHPVNKMSAPVAN